jgi:hypothetical protein
MRKIVIYDSPENLTQIEVKFDIDTFWLSLNQISKLFGGDKSLISRHLKKNYKENELIFEATVAKNATVQNEAGRDVLSHSQF